MFNSKINDLLGERLFRDSSYIYICFPEFCIRALHTDTNKALSRNQILSKKNQRKCD